MTEDKFKLVLSVIFLLKPFMTPRMKLQFYNPRVFRL